MESIDVSSRSGLLEDPLDLDPSLLWCPECATYHPDIITWQDLVHVFDFMNDEQDEKNALRKKKAKRKLQKMSRKRNRLS